MGEHHFAYRCVLLAAMDRCGANLCFCVLYQRSLRRFHSQQGTAIATIAFLLPSFRQWIVSLLLPLKHHVYEQVEQDI